MRNLTEELNVIDHPSFSTDALTRECNVMTQYLLGQRPPPDLIQRYIKANSVLLTSRTSRTDLTIVAFIQRNPWSLPYMDATSGILRPDSLLRRKILLMIAILEATPEFTDAFIPEPFTIFQFVCRLSGYGILIMARVFVGLFIYPFATSSR